MFEVQQRDAWGNGDKVYGDAEEQHSETQQNDLAGGNANTMNKHQKSSSSQAQPQTLIDAEDDVEVDYNAAVSEDDGANEEDYDYDGDDYDADSEQDSQNDEDYEKNDPKEDEKKETGINNGGKSSFDEDSNALDYQDNTSEDVDDYSDIDSRSNFEEEHQMESSDAKKDVYEDNLDADYMEEARARDEALHQDFPGDYDDTTGSSTRKESLGEDYDGDKQNDGKTIEDDYVQAFSYEYDDDVSENMEASEEGTPSPGYSPSPSVNQPQSDSSKQFFDAISKCNDLACISDVQKQFERPPKAHHFPSFFIAG